MGFQPPVPQQDTNWEIRVAVQASLALQVLLIFVTPLRRTSPSHLIRSVIWSCYLLADWVADLALGLLLNALGNTGPSTTIAISHASPKPNVGSDSSNGNGSSPIIFAFWAPFLLLHLGGPDTITAFSIEDNELWPRHLIGLLFELFSATTVFLCSLRRNPFILASAFMFVVGVIKYAERTYSLYCGSVDGLTESMLCDVPDLDPNYAKMMEEYDAKVKAGLPAEIYVPNAPDSTEPMIGQYLKKHDPLESNAFQLYRRFQYQFADLILSFNERKVSQKFFFELDIIKAFELIAVELGFVYDIIFTKAAIAHRRVGYVLRLIGSACIPAAFLAFFFADKRRFTRLDIIITYTLLAGAAVLDIGAFVMLLCSDWARVSFADKPLFKKCCVPIKNLRFGPRRRWSEKVSLMSLIDYCLDDPVGARVPKWVASRRVSWLANKVGVKKVLDETLFVRHEKVTEEMKEFIFKKLKVAASETSEADGHENINEAAASETSLAKEYEKMKEVCERRGAGALKKLKLELKLSNEQEQKLMKYVVVDFDESLLLWHIATELCYYEDKTEQAEKTRNQRRISLALSEYLVYLLVMKPAMLSTEAGIQLLRCRNTFAETRRFFARSGRPLTAEAARERLIRMNTSVLPDIMMEDRALNIKPVLFDAVILAKQLNTMEMKWKWEVISEVWAEMLMYTALNCKAGSHMRQLSHGGEFATVVWLLMAHVGLGKLFRIQASNIAKLIVDK